MKISNLIAAGSVAFGLASSAAFAQTKVYIAGAPALRSELTTAIENLLIGQPGVTRAYSGSAIITADVVEWTGASIGGYPVTIKLTYNGSAGGWKTNSASQTVRFLADAVAGNGASQTNVLTDLAATPVENAVPDFHISNEFQDSTPWIGTNSVSFPENGATTYQPLEDPIFGIMPIRLVASPAAPNGLNITPQLIQQVFINGSIRLSQLTGNVADFPKRVYGLNRGIDSGVRTIVAAATGIGTSTAVRTYQATTLTNTTNKSVAGVSVVSPGVGYTSAPTVTFTGGGGSGAAATATVANGKVTGFTITNGGSGYSSAPSVSLSGGGGSLASARAVIPGGTVTAQALWPATSGATRILGVATAIGNGGYPNFGPLLTAITSILNLPSGNAGDIYITPLAGADADSAIQGGAKEVAWNGVLLGTLGTYGNTAGVNTPDPNGGSSTPTLSNGSYDLWGYVRLPHRPGIGTVQLAVLEAIGQQLRDYDAPVLLKDVNIQRSSDGGTIRQGQLVQ